MFLYVNNLLCSTAARRVVERGNHTVDGSALSVSLIQPNRADTPDAAYAKREGKMGYFSYKHYETMHFSIHLSNFDHITITSIRTITIKNSKQMKSYSRTMTTTKTTAPKTRRKL